MRKLRCTIALLLWCSGFALLAALLLRYAILPEASQQAGYLEGVDERSRTTMFYQVMIVAFLGCAGYCVALMLALGAWIRQAGSGARAAPSVAARLAGLGQVDPADGGWQTEGPVVLQLAVNPIRDAAVIFPAIGFIGTVVGVTIAIGGLGEVLKTRDPAILLGGLRVAFDTTLLGLVASVALTALLYLIQSRSMILRALTGLV